LATWPGMDCRPSIRLLANLEAASMALDAISPTHEATLDITLPRNDAMLPGSEEMKLTTLLTNCEPADTALEAICPIHDSTLEMTDPRNDAMLPGSCWNHVIMP